MKDIIFPIIAVAFWVFIIVIVIVSERKRRRKLKDLATALNGEYVSSLFMIYCRLVDQGIEFRVRTAPKQKNTPPYLIVEMRRPIELKFCLQTQGHWSQRKFHLIWKRVSLYDPQMESKYRLHSNDPDRARFFFTNPQRLAAADHFLADGFIALETTRDGLTTSKPNYGDLDLQPDKIRSHFVALAKFVSA